MLSSTPRNESTSHYESPGISDGSQSMHLMIHLIVKHPTLTTDCSLEKDCTIERSLHPIMKRGFLNTKRAKRSVEIRGPDTPVEPVPIKMKLPIGKVDTTLPEGYVPSEAIVKEYDSSTTVYPDNACICTTLPSRSFGDTLADNPDNWTECLFLGGKQKREIVSTPGFPSPVPRPPQVRHRIGPSRFGIGMFATRNIKMGDLIVSERPLLVSPIAVPPLPLNLPISFEPTLLQIMQARMVEHEKRLENCLGRMLPENRAAFLALHNSHTEDGSGPIFGRIRTNGIGIIEKTKKSDLDAGDYGYTAVFDAISRINHSCAPNAAYGFTMASFSSQLRAIRDIKKDEEIFIAYCSTSEPTAERQASLKPYGFECTCSLCSDPTSDALLAKIKESTLEPSVWSYNRDPKGNIDRTQHSKDWMATIEASGQQGLKEYGTHISMLIAASAGLGRMGEYRKYKEMSEAWYLGRKSSM
ncbi:hypothetical protein D9615_008610 [Tricholomella constricta]|uniref:SET domain-containing protein n=1 Tax=Tricholomella constricta TaxID=117010 RepID=A0A8H5M0T4_9AGAR|nr:hypothetical protein D9615_008610 [Tricholomella constricta]